MARSKRSVTQSNWLFGQAREDLLEQDETDLRGSSAREISNMRILSTGSLLGREGMEFIRTIPGCFGMHELRPAPGLVFSLILYPSSISVFDPFGFEVFTAPGTFPANTWVMSRGSETRIGSQDHLPKVLSYNDGAWSLDDMVFDAGPGGALRQPYVPFEKGVTIQPSARTGLITITASASVFAEGHVGTRIRYHGREILIIGYTSGTVLTGTVLQQLPPTFDVTVDSADGFLVDEAVSGEDTLVEGIVTGITGAVVSILMTDGFEGPETTENLVAPNHRSEISETVEGTPAASTVWDEQLFSAVRGYPGACASVQRRVIYVDFPSEPALFCASSPDAGNDFTVIDGADNEAIIEKIGDESSERLRYVAAVDDLIILSDQAVYYHSMRSGGALTPEQFRPLKFASVGSAGVQPEVVDEGIVFVGEGGNRILAAVLQGDVNKSWTVRDLSEFAPDVIGRPVALGVTEGDSQFVERYIFAVRSDGVVALGRWQSNPEVIGWVPWTTQGRIVAMETLLGEPYVIVDRTIAGVPTRFWEKLKNGLYMDSAITYAGSVPHLAGETVAAYRDGAHVGNFPVAADGSIPDLPAGAYQVGLSYTPSLSLWPPEGIAQRRGFAQPRVGRVSFSVQGTSGYHVNGQRVGPFVVGDDIHSSPSLKTQVGPPVSLLGRYDHPEITIEKRDPGPIKVLSVSMEVSG